MDQVKDIRVGGKGGGVAFVGSIRANVVANYVSLGFTMVIGVFVLPIYLQVLGAEAYGLIGFYSVLAAGFQVLDLGLPQTLGRECARYDGGIVDALSLRRLVAAFETIFSSLAVAGGLAVVIAAPLIASHWLHPEHLSPGKVALSVALMGVAIPVQWVSGLYRGILIGFERQVRLAVLSIVITSFRFLGVLVPLFVIGAEPIVFFGHQAIVAVSELLLLVVMSRASLPSRERGVRLDLIPAIRGVLHFSTALTFSTICWLVMMQGDKIILSNILSLAAFGTFSLAASVTAAVVGIGAPIGQALLPRLTRLVGQDNLPSAVELYRRTTQLACLVSMPVAFVLAWFAEPFLWAWTGDRAVARSAAPILRAYAVGCAFMPVGAFPYYLQFAFGRLKLLVIGQVLLLLILIPSLILAALRFGAVGAGLAWTTVVLLYFLAWTPFVHHRYVPGLHVRWLARDIAPIAASTAVVASVLALALDVSKSRIGATAELALVGAIALLAGTAASSGTWSIVRNALRDRPAYLSIAWARRRDH